MLRYCRTYSEAGRLACSRHLPAQIFSVLAPENGRWLVLLLTISEQTPERSRSARFRYSQASSAQLLTGINDSIMWVHMPTLGSQAPVCTQQPLNSTNALKCCFVSRYMPKEVLRRRDAKEDYYVAGMDLRVLTLPYILIFVLPFPQPPSGNK